MRVDIVTVAYGLPNDTLKLFESVSSDKHDVHWHLFLHSKYPEVIAVCEVLAQSPQIHYYPYGVNRGIAKSWNEGLIEAMKSGSDILILANDDIVVGRGDLDKLANAAVSQRDKAIVTCHGKHIRSNIEGSIYYGFCVINPVAIERVGMFDESYFPLYGEDIDYNVRLARLGLEFGHCADTYVIHQGSQSIYTIPGLMEQNHETFKRNLEYHKQKWGGEYGREVYQTPFANPEFGQYIAPENRQMPYGQKYVRSDYGFWVL